jgi:NAD+ diphosphatase
MTTAARARTWFAVGKLGVLVRQNDAGEGSDTTFALPTRAELEELGLSPEAALASGTLGDTDCYAVSVPEDLALPAGWSHLTIRHLMTAFDAKTFHAAATAGHVLDWHTTSQFCGRCGTPTEPVASERCMKCPKCGLTQYPRIAPAVIVLVRRGEQALLARNGRFPVPFFSTLAGFTEVGETLEETIHREIYEEVGIKVKDTKYLGSQPWPFPHSLMVGFTAEYDSGDIKVDGEEIAEARFFSAHDLPLIPPKISIARRLIDGWLEEMGAPSPPDRRR